MLVCVLKATRRTDTRVSEFRTPVRLGWKLSMALVKVRGRSKMTSPGGGGRGSDRLVTNGDKGGREVLASGSVKKFIYIFIFASF